MNEQQGKQRGVGSKAEGGVDQIDPSTAIDSVAKPINQPLAAVPPSIFRLLSHPRFCLHLRHSHLMPPERLNPFDLPIQRILVDWETGLPPWMKLVRPSDEDNDSAFTRLSNEIFAFAELITPTPKERLVRQNISHRLEFRVEKIWQGAKVVPIGSYAQDLYTSSR